MVYGQTEITKELMDDRAAVGAVAPPMTSPGDGQRVSYRADSKARKTECDFIAGCDGFHSIRKSVPPGVGGRPARAGRRTSAGSA